ncbi:hypothetical protein WG70_00900 [Burkholderia oklahomensis EO147]|nr:hypothetical protein WG70_00900 [Burkholderia oklahomensis EO147]KUY48558.1 hypothetical protein WG70_02755 [Burkholderia oklahomensis EO147]
MSREELIKDGRRVSPEPESREPGSSIRSGGAAERQRQRETCGAIACNRVGTRDTATTWGMRA